jgi:hypothetical protein
MKNISIIFLLLLTIGCKKKEEETTKPENQKSIPLPNSSSNNSNSTEITNATATSENYKLLQGKWQNTADAKSITEFRKDLKINSYKGIGETDKAQFLLSDSCTVVKNPKNWNHIILVNSKFCYKIVDIDSRNLEISFSGTKTTLRYKKL